MKPGDRVRITYKGLVCTNLGREKESLFGREGVIIFPFVTAEWVIKLDGDCNRIFDENDLQIIAPKNCVTIEDMK